MTPKERSDLARKAAAASAKVRTANAGAKLGQRIDSLVMGIGEFVGRTAKE